MADEVLHSVVLQKHLKKSLVSSGVYIGVLIFSVTGGFEWSATMHPIIFTMKMDQWSRHTCEEISKLLFPLTQHPIGRIKLHILDEALSFGSLPEALVHVAIIWEVDDLPHHVLQIVAFRSSHLSTQTLFPWTEWPPRQKCSQHLHSLGWHSSEPDQIMGHPPTDRDQNRIQ